MVRKPGLRTESVGKGVEAKGDTFLPDSAVYPTPESVTVFFHICDLVAVAVERNGNIFLLEVISLLDTLVVGVIQQFDGIDVTGNDGLRIK